MLDWILSQPTWLFYVSLSFFLLGGALGLPFPEDLGLIATGIAIHNGVADWLPVSIFAYVNILLGDILIYSIGRKLGPRLFEKKWIKKRFTPKKIRKTRFRLERKSLLMIFVARHLFYFRSATFLLCGAVKMKFIRFLIADAVAALISAPIMIFIGYYAAENYESLLEKFSKFQNIFIAIMVLVIGLYYYKKKIERDKRKNKNLNEKI